MNKIDAFPFGSATGLAAAIRNREVSAVELLTAYLQRVDQYNPGLNAIVVDNREQAMADAKAADLAIARGDATGPLHGVPMTVKESFDLKGHPTTQGFVPMRGNMASEDAVAVQRLKAAGAVIFGKTNVPLFLGDFQSYNEIYGTTNNPWDVARAPGGSSGGGAAALASGMTSLEFGSDIGGSIRNPAAYCGVFGHKPTWTVVPKRGHHLARTPIAEADLSVIGPLARSADDLALALRVTAGPDALTARGVHYAFPEPPHGVKGLRVAVWIDEPLSPVEACIRAGIERAATALQRDGAIVDFDARPDFVPAELLNIYETILWANVGARRADFDQVRARIAALAPDDESPAAKALRALAPTYKQVYDAGNRREELRWAWKSFFDRFDVLLAPVTATPAFPHDHSEPPSSRTMKVDGRDVPYFAQLFWAGLATAPLLPATVVPIGTSPEGLPIALQVLGPEMADRTTIWTAGEIGKRMGGFTPPRGYD